MLGRAPSWWAEEEDSTVSKNVSTCTLCVTLHQCLCMQFILVIVHLLKEEWDQPICQEGLEWRWNIGVDAFSGHQSPLYLSSFYCLAEQQAMTFGFGHFWQVGFHIVWIKKRRPIYSSLSTYITLLQPLSSFCSCSLFDTALWRSSAPCNPINLKNCLYLSLCSHS